MKKIICCSHGKLAAGMLDTVRMIAGNFDFLEYYCAYENGNEDVGQIVDKFIKENSENELFVITDIYGGSVNNEWMKRIHKENNIHLIAGMNLAFIIELSMLLNADAMDSVQAIKQAMSNAADNFIYCNEMALDTSEEEF